MSKLRVLDLFSGIGCFSRGLVDSGAAQPVGFVEIDPFCRAVLARHFPGVPVSDDITTRDFREGEADIIVGGFPCQDLSEAGLGAGLAGARSGLWRQMVRALRLVRPLYAIVENVAALLHRGMGTVLGDLAEIGYDAQWDCIPIGALGAPHERDRVWIIAHLGPVKGWALDIARRRVSWGVSLLGHRPENPGKPQAISEAAWGDDAVMVADALSRMDDGSPVRLRGFDALANSLAPQIPELIGRAILSAREAA